MTIIPVSEWAPDAARLGNRGSPVIKNAVPGTNSYKPMPQFQALTSALAAQPLGAYEVRDRADNVYQYAGTSAALYQLSGTSWADVSLGGGYSTGSEERWHFVKWKNKILATNYTDEIQTITIGGANFADLTSAFRCRRLAVVRDFVVAANTFDGTDGEISDRVRWSAFNDETDWTVDPSTGADFRDLKGGPIQQIFGGEHGLIFSRDSTWRMDYSGAPDWFQINETLPGVGLLAPNAAARLGNVVYAWTGQGFLAIQNGTGYSPIGEGKVDRTAFMDLDDAYLNRISTVVDPKSGRVFWAYPGSGHSGGRPNKIVCYDTNLNRWSEIEQEVEMLWRSGGVGYTLEQLDAFSSSIDDLDVSLDSSQWKGDGRVLLAAFNSTYAHGFFEGAPMTGEIEIKEMEINAGRRTMLGSFRPLVEGGSFTAQIGSRNKLTDDISYSAVLSPTSTGRVTKRSNARYHTIRVNPTGDWENFIGVSIERDDARVTR